MTSAEEIRQRFDVITDEFAADAESGSPFEPAEDYSDNSETAAFGPDTQAADD